MGLINKQILIVNQKRIKEIIDKITLKERHPTGENTTAVLLLRNYLGGLSILVEMFLDKFRGM